jgi:hypothetical protein
VLPPARSPSPSVSGGLWGLGYVGGWWFSVRRCRLGFHRRRFPGGAWSVEAASRLWNKFLLAFLYLAVMFSSGGGGPVREKPSGSRGPVVSLVCIGSYFGVLSRRLPAAMMSAAGFLSLRVISGDCGGGNTSSGVKLVRYVVHKLEKSSLCFHIPFLGLLLLFGGGRPSRHLATDPFPCDEDWADWRSSVRSSCTSICSVCCSGL